MTPQEQKFVDLANKIEALNKQRKELQVQLDSAMLELGIGHVVKSEDGTVYRVQKYSGKFISPKELEYVRTKRDGEVRGSLSKKEADELVSLRNL